MTNPIAAPKDKTAAGRGPGQLEEPVVIWLRMLRTFAQGLAAPVPAVAPTS